MARATFFFRNKEGIIITEITDSETALNIGQRLQQGGFMIGRDSIWRGGAREVVINLEDVSCVIIERDQRINQFPNEEVGGENDRAK